LQHHKQGQEKKSREEWDPAEGSRQSGQPLGCSPSMLNAALLSKAQLLHMECVMQVVACAAGCVRARHTLGSGVPRLHAWVCVRCAHAHACAHHPFLICTDLYNYQVYKRLTVLQRWREAGEYKDDACPLQRSKFSGQSIYSWATTNL